MTEGVPTETSSEAQSEEEDERAFQQQPPTSDTKAFMSSIWKGMKIFFKGQVRLKKKVKEQNERLQ